MLIWINTSLGPAAIDNGVVRARDAQLVRAVDKLHIDWAVEHENLRADAARQVAAELDAARTEAAQLLADARRSADEMQQQAYEEGTRKAMHDWHERGISAAVEKNDAMRGTHEQLAEIVSNAVERIVHSEDRATLYRRALKNVQSLTRNATTLRLRVGPSDYASAMECIAGIPDVETAGLQVEVVADSSLRPGACVFESDVGVLDASIETQLDALRSAMARAVTRAAKDDAPLDAALDMSALVEVEAAS